MLDSTQFCLELKQDNNVAAVLARNSWCRGDGDELFYLLFLLGFASLVKLMWDREVRVQNTDPSRTRGQQKLGVGGI